MNVVLDTNVYIEGLKDDYSYERQILDEVISGRIIAYANRQTMQENRLLISQLITNPEYQLILDQVMSQVLPVDFRTRLNIVRDPEDNKILSSAVDAEAEYLITRDNDLLTLEKYGDIKIVTPAEFWNQYHDSGKTWWDEFKSFIN